MKNLRKTLASVAIIAALVAGCQTNSPTPEVVVVKKPDPITPADTTKKDTTKVVVVPPTPVSPKVIAGQKCYEARVIQAFPLCGVVVQILNDSIGVKSKITIIEPDGKVVYKEFSNIVTLTIQNYGTSSVKEQYFIARNSWVKSGKVYFTIDKIEENVKGAWGYASSGQNFSGGEIAHRGVIVSSYSTESCKP